MAQNSTVELSTLTKLNDAELTQINTFFKNLLSKVPEDRDNAIPAKLNILDMREINQYLIPSLLLRNYFLVDKSVQLIQSKKFTWDRYPTKDRIDHFKAFTGLPCLCQLDIYPIGNLFREVFKPQEISCIFEQTYPKVGGCEGFDGSIRIKSALLRGFYGFYFLKTFSNSTKIDTDNVLITDPFQRCRIRQANRSNSELTSIYFTQEFDLKKFIYLAAKELLPQANFRWLGPFQFGVVYVLWMIERMLEYGIYDIDDLQELVDTIFKRVQQISNLEEKCLEAQLAGNLSAPFRQELISNFQKCRVSAVNICIHIITFINDAEVMRVGKLGAEYKFLKIRNYAKGNKFSELFIQKTRYHPGISQIIFRYILKKSYLLNGENGKIDMITDQLAIKLHSSLLPNFLTEDDSYIKSFELLQPNYLNYYYSKDFSITSIQKIAEDIKNKLIALNNNIATLPKITEDFLKEFASVLKNISSILDQSKKSNSQIEILNSQIILAEANIIDLLITLYRYVVDEISDEVQQLIVVIASEICKDNFVAQSKLFEEFTYMHLENIMDKQPVKIIQILYEMFKTDPYILHIHTQIREKLIDIYKAYIERFQKKIATGEDVKKELLSIHFMNKMFQTLLNIRANKFLHKTIIVIEFRIQKILQPIIVSQILPHFNAKEMFVDPKGNIIYSEQSEKYNDTDQDKLRLKTDVYFSTLQLFHRASRNLYFKEVYDGVINSYKGMEIKEYLITNENLCKFQLELFIGYLNFVVIPQNHVFNERTPWNKMKDTKLSHERSYLEELINDNIVVLKKMYESLPKFPRNAKNILDSNFGSVSQPFIFPLLKLLKTIMVSYEIVEVNEAKKIIDQLLPLLEIFRINLPSLREISNIAEKEFPTIFNWDKNVDKINEGMLESVEKKNEKLFELRAICYQVVDYLESILPPSDEFIKSIYNRKLLRNPFDCLKDDSEKQVFIKKSTEFSNQQQNFNKIWNIQSKFILFSVT